MRRIIVIIITGEIIIGILLLLLAGRKPKPLQIDSCFLYDLQQDYPMYDININPEKYLSYHNMSITSCSFGIYLVSSCSNYDIFRYSFLSDHLNSYCVFNKPIISENDIVQYDWEKQTMKLTQEAYKRIYGLKSNLDVIHGLPFIVVANKERCYFGAFWTSYSSAACNVPIILFDLDSDECLQIYPWYPPPLDTMKFIKIDPRINDIRIYDCLVKLGKLKKAGEEKDSGDSIPNQDE